MATNSNEKKRIVESMIKEERMSRFACELGSPDAVKVNMKQNTLIVFIPFVFLFSFPKCMLTNGPIANDDGNAFVSVLG